MAIQDLISKIILEDQFSKAFDDYERRLTKTDSETGKFQNRLGGLAVGFGVVVGGLAAGAVALDELTDAAVQNQQAIFNVGAAAAAANSEFGDSVGTIESWTNSVEAASDQFRVFGDQDVANATARLIDMTKRLGFSEEQMNTLRARTADLSAGKTDLTGGIERVTAAMRGEAESAEFLGLSLSETQVRAYAEAHGLVFKELSDNEKAQLRYQLFLEQTDALQGRAAESAKTLAGQEAELARLRERAIADIGGQLLPLRQGEVAAWQLLAGTAQDSGGIVTNILAAITASYIAFGATAKAILDSQVAQLGVWAEGFQSVWAALEEGRSPLEAINRTGLALAENNAKAVNAITNYASTWSASFEQVRSSYEQATSAQTDFNIGTQNGIATQNEFASAGQSAASTIAQAYEDLAADRERLQDQLNARIEAAEFDHAQRVIRIQQDIARATAEAAAEAATAREEAATRLAEGLAEIERNLAEETARAAEQANAQLDRLNQERVAAKRQTAREIRQVERDLETELSNLERDTGEAIADVNQELADDLADRQAKAETDKLKIIQDAATARLRLEQQFADRRRSINDQFESEFADADPFRRQILEFNRQEALSQLEQQQADEEAALDAQTQAQLDAVDARVAAEAAILEREAQQKRERLEREAAERAEALRREAEERTAALEARLADEIEANNRRREEIQRSLAEEQARRDAAAAEARAKLEQKNTEELAAIDQQEAEKVARAEEALARENQNFADKLAQLRFSNQQELEEINAKLLEVEQEELASYTRRLAEARSFADQRRQILSNSFGSSAGFGANPGTLGFADGGVVPGPAGRAVPAVVHGGETVLPPGVAPEETNNYITINNYGVQNGFAGGARTARSVKDALEGF